MFFTASIMLAAGCVPSSAALMMSTGEAEVVDVRSVRRVPITTIALSSLGSSALCVLAASAGSSLCALAGSASSSDVAIAVDANRVRRPIPVVPCAIEMPFEYGG
ncbi:MAG: hypothetical protein WDN24_00995 [Sphingomonas sp.]